MTIYDTLFVEKLEYRIRGSATHRCVTASHRVNDLESRKFKSFVCDDVIKIDWLLFQLEIVLRGWPVRATTYFPLFQ